MIALTLAKNDDRSSRTRHWIGFGAVAVLGVLLAALIFGSFRASATRHSAERWYVHTLQVLLVTEQLRSAANEAMQAERGYLITGDEHFLEGYDSATVDAPRLVQDLDSLTRDNPVQQARLPALRHQLARYLSVLKQTISLTRAGRGEDAVGVVRRGVGQREIEALEAIVEGAEQEERRLLALRQAEFQAANRSADRAIVAVAAIGLLFLVIVAWAGWGASRARLRTLFIEAQLRRAATTDELTGLLNRRAFFAEMDVQIARSARAGVPLSLAVIDLDHFKSVNDRFGHHGGDLVLRRFAEIARETVRAGDVVGRLGGEEFAVLMPDTRHADAGIAAERIREAAAGAHVAMEDGATAFTISVGVADHRPREDRDRLLIRADEALYEAKNQGRNRTHLAA